MLVLFAQAQAAIITIDAKGTGDYPTIQAAIDDANNGDEIVLLPGRYTGPGNRDISTSKAVTVRGTDPNDWDTVAATIIDCNATVSDRHCGFQNWSNSNSVISGLTVTNGYANNWVYWGAYAQPYAGGGFFKCNSTVKNCIIEKNEALGDAHNPGVYDPSSGFGGAFYYCPGPITKCIIRNNSAADGGAFNLVGEIRGCIISNNSADYVSVADAFGYLTNCIISNNVSNYDVLRSYQASITNCTIANNSLNSGNKIIDNNGVISDCIIWGNDGEDLGDYIPAYSCIQGWTGGGLGNISSDPCFADADANDFHLKSAAGRWDPNSHSWVTDSATSPCVDAGDPNSDFSNEPAPHGNRINAGAYGNTPEASKSDTGCFPASHPDYPEWVAVGKPECWCYPKQCHGDATGTPELYGGRANWVAVGLADLQVLLDAYNDSSSTYSNPDPRICADFSHDEELYGSRTNWVHVGLADLQILLQYYNDPCSTVPADCLE